MTRIIPLKAHLQLRLERSLAICLSEIHPTIQPESLLMKAGSNYPSRDLHPNKTLLSGSIMMRSWLVCLDITHTKQNTTVCLQRITAIIGLVWGRVDCRLKYSVNWQNNMAIWVRCPSLLRWKANCKNVSEKNISAYSDSFLWDCCSSELVFAFYLWTCRCTNNPTFPFGRS